jgi:hypothetical protein
MAKTRIAKSGISTEVTQFARMWPREIFDHLPEAAQKKPLAKSIEFLNQPGVYILYRDDIPYYIGRADKLRSRLWSHANKPSAKYYNFWNFFSAFVIPDRKHMIEIEGILIAAMPTANSAHPRLQREKFPLEVIAMVRHIRQDRANPNSIRFDPARAR